MDGWMPMMTPYYYNTNCTTYPIPKSKHVIGIDPKRLHTFRIGRQCRKMFGHGTLIPTKGIQNPLFPRPRIRHCFLRRKCFGRDQKECRFGITLAQNFRHVRSINIRTKVHRQSTPNRIRLQGFTHHDRS